MCDNSLIYGFEMLESMPHVAYIIVLYIFYTQNWLIFIVMCFDNFIWWNMITKFKGGCSIYCTLYNVLLTWKCDIWCDICYMWFMIYNYFILYVFYYYILSLSIIYISIWLTIEIIHSMIVEIYTCTIRPVFLLSFQIHFPIYWYNVIFN